MFQDIYSIFVLSTTRGEAGDKWGIFGLEVTTILRRAVVVKLLSAAEALGRLHILAVKSVHPTQASHVAVLEWCERLGQRRAYDAQYLALAEKLGVELWTADQPKKLIA